MSRYGNNSAYIDELHRKYLEDPASVSPAWREFFEDFRSASDVQAPAAASQAGSSQARSSQTAPPQSAPSPPPGAAQGSPPPEAQEPEGELLKGIAAKIAENMNESIEVPTATSVREIPVKLLEENRRLLNQHQQTMSGPKVSFTHLIAWAIVRALGKHPGMCAAYSEASGEARVIRRTEVNLGLAIDMEKRGERVLLVPNIKDAGALNFPGFLAAYNELVSQARNNKLTLDQFQGTNISLTNPGMLGTALSVPRLMSGQSAIIGVGSIGYPAEYSGMAPEMISELGLSKVMTITSTYDHRVIQGAESGQFLATVESFVQGADRFWDSIFEELNVPQEPMVWSGDLNPQILGSSGGSNEAIAKQAGVLSLIRAYRVRGNLWADLDPLDYKPQPNPELELSSYGLTAWDLDRKFLSGGLGGHEGMLTLREILDVLRRTYCWHVGVEYMHIQDEASRKWIQEHLEQSEARQAPAHEDQLRILERLNVAEAFENFLGTSYIGQKRFSLEGAETVIPMLDFLCRDAVDCGVEQMVMGMSHRGRLNVLAHVVGKTYGQIFKEFEGIDPESTYGSGDVKYHLGATGTYADTRDRPPLQVILASNPSHLEAVDPVVEGMARALQDMLSDQRRERILPVLLHGDAAFSGQGVVAETLHLSMLSGYRTGGTIHLVINNQIGFTTRPQDLRSSQYCTDVAKMVKAPIFHVNGDHPEEAVRVMRHALAYRQEFKRDVVIDLVCYRRWGHNEGDDPSYTSPLLYSKIRNHRSVRKLYTEQLLRRGDIDMETAEKALKQYQELMREVHDEVKNADVAPSFTRADDLESLELSTSWSDEIEPLSRDLLERVLDGIEKRPEGFNTHPKLEKLLGKRRTRFEEGRIDWGTAEHLAFGSLCVEGIRVRLSGEDSGRGTFSQRHSCLHDHQTGEQYVPLQHIDPQQAPFSVYDSLLSEFAVLGFEYGYSVLNPRALVLWEAQFGDFVNGAQVIIDQFICSAESKWGQVSSVVMLLPHGFEGQGPEHSSARIERFLQLAAQRNIRVAYPSTPAQYFHLLRAQSLIEERKPLIVMTPKSLLRLPACVSTAEELYDGGWNFLIPDEEVAEKNSSRLILCSGKVYYDLAAERAERGIDNISIARVEYLYPVPADSLRELLQAHAHVRDIVWVQEEPRNQGAWSFVHDRFTPLLQDGQTLRYVGRPRSASPATGSAQRHQVEQATLVSEALDLNRESSESRPALSGKSAR